MARTKWTRNGREVRAMSNFDYGSEEAFQQSNKDGDGGGSEEAVQQAKKSGKRGASVSLSPERSRKNKRVEGIEMLASTPPSKTRRGTSYGSPAKKGGDGSASVTLSSPEKTTRHGTSYGGSTLSRPNSKKKQKVTTETVARPGNSKKKQKVTKKIVTVTTESVTYGDDDKEECPTNEDVLVEAEEFGAVGDEGRLSLADDGDELEDENGIGGIEEENCRDLGLHFGDEAINDECEIDEDEGDDYAWDENKIPDPVSSDDENEEEMIPAQAYRADTDPEELLQLGKTFSDAENFKHTCLRYTLKTRYNIRFYISSSLKMGAKCAAEMRDDEVPCPWMVYCSYDRRKQKLMVKTYINDHRCEKTGQSRILKRSAIASLFAERLRLNPKITAKEIQAEILREYQMDVKENSCIKAKTKVMRERRKTHEEHFDKIWDYQAEIFRSNPGSTMDIETIPRKYQGLHFEASEAQASQAQSSQAHSSQAQASPWEAPQSSQGQPSRWEIPQSSQASQTGTCERWFS